MFSLTHLQRGGVKSQHVTFPAVPQQVSSWRGRGRALARYWPSPGQRRLEGRSRCCWRRGQGRGYEEKSCQTCCLFQYILWGSQSADSPGHRDDRRSEAAAGYDWLLLGNGRGYSWRELSLDHASWRHNLDNINVTLLSFISPCEGGDSRGVCCWPWCPLTSGRILEEQSGSGGGQGAELSAVCQKPEPSL